MSNRKRVRPNYQQMYQQERDRAWDLERQKRDLQERNRRQQVIADQIAESEYRTRQAMYQVQNQVIEAEQQAATERARLAELQQSVLRDVAGVRVNLQATRDTVDTWGWENRELHQLAQQSRDQIQREIISGVEENRQLHQIAQEQRRSIQDAVNRNAQSLEQNRQAIEENGRLIEQAIETVEDQDRRKRLDQMRSAARLIEQSVQFLYSVPQSWLQRFAPDHFAKTSQMVNEAATNLQNELYEAALAVGTAAITRAATITGQVKEAQAEYQRHWERAEDALSSVERKIGELNRDETHLWCEQEYTTLKNQADELRKQLEKGSLVDMNLEQDQLDLIRASAQDVLDRAQTNRSSRSHKTKNGTSSDSPMCNSMWRH